MLLSDARDLDLRTGSPRLLMLAGLPGVGKSAFAREVASRCPFLKVESDRLRKALVPQPQYTPDEHRRVFRLATGFWTNCWCKDTPCCSTPLT